MHAALGGEPDIRCIGYGVPPVMTEEMALACAGFVTTIVHNVSVEAFLSTVVILRLRG